MANQSHLKYLKQGNTYWNAWRKKNPDSRPNLAEANLGEVDLRGIDLSGANLRGAILKEADLREANLQLANLSKANLSLAYLREADLTGADLFGADLFEADLTRANLSGANLSGANLGETVMKEINLTGANLREADLFCADLSSADFTEADLRKAKIIWAELSEATLLRANLSEAILQRASFCEALMVKANLQRADLRSANLTQANLQQANLRNANLNGANISGADISGADLTECSIYAISAWNVVLNEETNQSGLIITKEGEPTITIDNLEVAQFIYLILNNKKIRDIIDTVAKKVVLILGRFTDERKVVLLALKRALREQGYLPVLFDFDEPVSRDVTETVITLAHMSRFIIADITEPKSIPQELALIVPNLPSVPVQPLLHSSEREYGMFAFFTKFPWVLPLYIYTDQASLLQSLKVNVIDPAEQKAVELAKR